MQVKGFTLLEVLISGVILFMAISAATLVYTSSIKSNERAMESLAFSSYTPILIESIKTELRETQTSQNPSGEGALPNDVKYRWTAKVQESSAAAAVFSDEGAEFRSSNRTIILWQVDLILSNAKAEHRYDFLVTAWSEI